MVQVNINGPFKDYIKSLHDAQKKKDLDEKLEALQREAEETLRRQANAQFNWYGFGNLGGAFTQTPVQPVIPEKVSKVFALYKGTSNEGEKQAAEQALKRFGYKIVNNSLVKE